MPNVTTAEKAERGRHYLTPRNRRVKVLGPHATSPGFVEVETESGQVISVQNSYALQEIDEAAATSKLTVEKLLKAGDDEIRTALPTLTPGELEEFGGKDGRRWVIEAIGNELARRKGVVPPAEPRPAPAVVPKTWPPLERAEEQLAVSNRIQAVTTYRHRVGCDLKTAQGMVQAAIDAAAEASARNLAAVVARGAVPAVVVEAVNEVAAGITDLVEKVDAMTAHRQGPGIPLVEGPPSLGLFDHGFDQPGADEDARETGPQEPPPAPQTSQDTPAESEAPPASAGATETPETAPPEERDPPTLEETPDDLDLLTGADTDEAVAIVKRLPFHALADAELREHRRAGGHRPAVFAAICARVRPAAEEAGVPPGPDPTDCRLHYLPDGRAQVWRHRTDASGLQERPEWLGWADSPEWRPHLAVLTAQTSAARKATRLRDDQLDAFTYAMDFGSGRDRPVTSIVAVPPTPDPLGQLGDILRKCKAEGLRVSVTISTDEVDRG